MTAFEDWQPGDRIGRVWPSDELRNFSADGRAMGRQAAAVFRDALNAPVDERPSGLRPEGAQGQRPASAVTPKAAGAQKAQREPVPMKREGVCDE